MEIQREEELRKKIDPLAVIFRERIVSKLREKEKEELRGDSLPIPRTVGSYAVIVRTPREKLSEAVEEVTKEIHPNHCPFCGATRKTDEELADHIVSDHVDKEPSEEGEWIIE